LANRWALPKAAANFVPTILLSGTTVGPHESGADRLSRIDPVTGKVSTVADGLAMDAAAPANIPPGYAFSSVAVDSYGTILVSGAGAERNVVYRIRAIPAR
jgi:hypothetical protein